MCVSHHPRWPVPSQLAGREPQRFDDKDLIAQARITLEAARLVRLGARAALVCQLTGLPKTVVRRLYSQVTGRSSPPGQMPFTDTWYLRCNQRLLHANVVWRLYQHLESNESSSACVLIRVYESYRAIVTVPVLTLTRAFFVPRLVSIRAWSEQSCDACRVSYIGPLDKTGSTCPACAEYFKRRCRHCTSALDYHPSGCWKRLCQACHHQLEGPVPRKIPSQHGGVRVD